MGHIISILATCAVLLIFVIVGVAASIYSSRHLIWALQTGVIEQSGRRLSFQETPARFVGGMIHIALGFLAALICIGVVVILIVRKF